MRPGLVFIALFVLLLAVHQLLVDRLGDIPTFIVQAAIIAVLLAAALWLRSRRGGGP